LYAYADKVDNPGETPASPLSMPQLKFADPAAD
jgi:hypothetical protein